MPEAPIQREASHETLTPFASQRRRRDPTPRTIDAVQRAVPRPEPTVRVGGLPPTPGQVANRRRRVRLVVEDVETGERTILAELVTWRSIEVLGSAALHYAAHYDNTERPFEQLRARRTQANQLGTGIWDAAEAKVGIETP